MDAFAATEPRPCGATVVAALGIRYVEGVRVWLGAAGAVVTVGLWACGSAPSAKTQAPQVVPIAAPTADSHAAPEPAEAVAAPATPPSRLAAGSCPFETAPVPAEPCEPDLVVPGLGDEKPGPQDEPIGLPSDIARARDARLRQQRKVSRALLTTEAKALERLFRATPQGDPDRPALLRRIAQAHVDLARDAAGAQDKTGAAHHRSEAIRYYEQFVTDHAGHQEMDQVLYYLALEQERSGDLSAARKTYLELVQSAPQSRFVPHAYFAFAELFFHEARTDPSKLPMARKLYEQVVKHPGPDNPLHGWAWHRMGQAAWRERDPTRALSDFTKALQYAHQFPNQPQSSQLDGAAWPELVFVYAEVGRPDRACAFFHRVLAAPPSSKKTIAALEQLAGTYLRQGKRDEAIVLHRLLARYQADPVDRCYAEAVVRSLNR